MVDKLIGSDEKLMLTSQELAYFQGFLKVGDRSGFYIDYCNMMGSSWGVFFGAEFLFDLYLLSESFVVFQK